MVEHKDYLNKNIKADSPRIVDRVKINHVEDYLKKDQFKLSTINRRYDQQFYSMYQYRLSTLKKRVDENALKKWGDGTKVVDGQTIVRKDKILDIRSGQLCWVSGTIYSELKNKLNILLDIEKGVEDVLPKAPTSYVEGNDYGTIMLEDESGRAILFNDDFLRNNILVTGCIVAVLGIEVQAGIFEIMDVVYPTLTPQRPLKTNNGKIALISGLNIEEAVNYDLKLELLKQSLSGELGSDEDNLESSQIAKLIIAGDSIQPIEEVGDGQDFFTTNNYGSRNISKFNPESLIKLDNFISDLLPTIPVSVMPGKDDPAEICIPQQPMHKAIFTNNMQYIGSENFESLTNPMWIEINGIRILGTSGQNVDDILKYLPEDAKRDHIITKIMESNIKWQNIVPTAPDTLYCYPYDNSDPFILNDETPHVYFVGNQTKYESKMFSHENVNIRLISVPKFNQTGQFVLLDLNTLDTQLITIEL